MKTSRIFRLKCFLAVIAICACLSAAYGKTAQTGSLSASKSGIISEELKNAKQTASIDYSDQKNWAYHEADADKKVDVFLICPTVDLGVSGNTNMSMNDEAIKANFLGALNMERGIYDSKAAMYAPYYRQASFPEYEKAASDSAKSFQLAYEDIKNAFDYYMKNENNGKPIILAGFSQGSDIVIRLMKDEFDKEAYQKQLIAAYCIGWHITQEELNRYPWLKMAQNATDTGCIITFNSEAEGITESLVVPHGIKTLGINPLNWKTDSTMADKSLNLGACFTDYKAVITKETPHLTGAYLDAKRGTLKTVDIVPADYSNGLLPDGVYHLFDYQFFYRNLQQNVEARIAAWFEGKQNF